MSRSLSSSFSACGCSTWHGAHAATSRTQTSHSLLAALLVRSPQGQVVAEQLHDQRGVFIGLLCNIVELCDGILECCASHLACLIRISQHFVLKDRVIQSKAEADGVRNYEVFLCDIVRILVSLTGRLRCLLFVTA